MLSRIVPLFASLINKKTKQMQKAAGGLDFETAAEIRDEIKSLKDILFEL